MVAGRCKCALLCVILYPQHNDGAQLLRRFLLCFRGTVQFQPTISSDATFPSSISTPTSPIDSNMSSVEVPNSSCPSLSTWHPTYALANAPPFGGPRVCCRICSIPCPRLIPGYDRCHTRARQAICRRAYGRVCNLRGVNGEPIWELQDVQYVPL